MPRSTDWRVGLGVLFLSATLGHALAAASAVAPDTTTAHWNHGVLEVTVDGAAWSQAIPFQALAHSRTYRQRFARSSVTAQQNMHPDGPQRAAQAQFKGHTWLRWGQGTAPLALDSPGEWPYRLIADAAAGANPPQYLWSNADASQRVVATPNRIQKVRTPHATWCAWFTVTGTQETRPHMADGVTPTLHWMLWRRPGNAACR